MSKRPTVDTGVLPHRLRCIRPPIERNPLYPLPPDYRRMEPEEKRWWRVNACCIQETPWDLVIAYAFFTHTYLWPEEAMFYENRQLSPPAHYQLVYDVAAYKLNALAGPREFCKSTLIRILDMLFALTRRGYRIGNVFSIQSACRESFSMIREQLQSNPLLLNDFGRVRPTGHSRAWSREVLELGEPFKSRIVGMWLKGASRGRRCDWLAFDDGEVDPETEEVVPELVRRLEKMLFRVYLPMTRVVTRLRGNPHIQRRGVGVLVAGTIIQENMLLARLVSTEEGSRYDHWNRWRLRQEIPGGKFLWPERLGGEETELLIDVYGHEVYDSEFLNQPGESSGGRFTVHPVYHGYTVEDKDHHWEIDPHNSQAIVRYGVRPTFAAGGETLQPEYFQIPVWEWLQGMDIAVIVDWAGDRPSATSDYHAIHVLGSDWESTLWSLDLQLGRFPSDFGRDLGGMTSPYEAVTEALVRMCLRWRPRRICMEAVGGFGHVSDAVFSSAKDRLLDGLGYLPVPYKLVFNKRSQSKGVRIDQCWWRAKMDKWRFPVGNRAKWPYSELFHQLNLFEITLTGLRYDDAIDTLGMSNYVFSGPGGRQVRTDPYAGLTVVELIERGKLYADDGHCHLEAVPSYSVLSPKALEVLDNATGRRNDQKRFEAPRRRI